MNFLYRHINRTTYPTKHVLICEDDLNNQTSFLKHFETVFEPQGEVQVSIVPGSIMAAAIIHYSKVDLIILDHDLPEGNGSDLLNWLKQFNINIPVITASGIDYNNVTMQSLGAKYSCFNKADVIAGKADNLIKNILFPKKLDNIGLAETYINKFAGQKDVIVSRYWVTPNIIVGGNINDNADFQNLLNKYNIGAIINADALQAHDEYKGIVNVFNMPVPDNGDFFPQDQLLKMLDFAQENKDKVIYIHCHLGMSRSPHFAYAILRDSYKLSAEDAYKMVWESLPTQNQWGFSNHTSKYVECIENALKTK